MHDERKPFWPWIVALLIGMPVLYVLSVGPASWISNSSPQWLRTAFDVFYWPLEWVYEKGPSFIHDALDSYIRLFQ